MICGVLSLLEHENMSCLCCVSSQALLEFLSKVVAFEEKNRMSLWNVSMIVAPNLFIFRGKNARQEEMQGAVGSAHLVRLLIKHQDLLWTVRTPHCALHKIHNKNMMIL